MPDRTVFAGGLQTPKRRWPRFGGSRELNELLEQQAIGGYASGSRRPDWRMQFVQLTVNRRSLAPIHGNQHGGLSRLLKLVTCHTDIEIPDAATARHLLRYIQDAAACSTERRWAALTFVNAMSQYSGDVFAYMPWPCTLPLNRCYLAGQILSVAPPSHQGGVGRTLKVAGDTHLQPGDPILAVLTLSVPSELCRVVFAGVINEKSAEHYFIHATRTHMCSVVLWGATVGKDTNMVQKCNTAVLEQRWSIWTQLQQCWDENPNNIPTFMSSLTKDQTALLTSTQELFYIANCSPNLQCRTTMFKAAQLEHGRLSSELEKQKQSAVERAQKHSLTMHEVDRETYFSAAERLVSASELAWDGEGGMRPHYGSSGTLTFVLTDNPPSRQGGILGVAITCVGEGTNASRFMELGWIVMDKHRRGRGIGQQFIYKLCTEQCLHRGINTLVIHVCETLSQGFWTQLGAVCTSSDGRDVPPDCGRLRWRFDEGCRLYTLDVIEYLKQMAPRQVQSQVDLLNLTRRAAALEAEVADAKAAMDLLKEHRVANLTFQSIAVWPSAIGDTMDVEILIGQVGGSVPLRRDNEVTWDYCDCGRGPFRQCMKAWDVCKCTGAPGHGCHCTACERAQTCHLVWR